MIQGIVNNRTEAVVKLRLRGPSGVDLEIEAIIDSGFTASLTLPASTILNLGLVRSMGGIARLADGSVRQYDLYEAELEWVDTWMPILVSAIGSEALVGMKLLSGHRLSIDVIPGGPVSIAALP
jgi:predicted aspartyl protease